MSIAAISFNIISKLETRITQLVMAIAWQGTGLRAGRQGIHARLLQKGHMGKITYKWGIWLKARKGGDGLGEKRK